MNRKRVYEIATQLHMDKQALVELLQSMEVEGVRNHMSFVETGVAERVMRYLNDRQSLPAWTRPREAAVSETDGTEQGSRIEVHHAALDDSTAPRRSQKPSVQQEASMTAIPDIVESEFLHPSPRPPDRTNEPREGETFGTEFLDNMAHQMVAPLQSIVMHCTSLVKGQIPEGKRDQRLREVIGHAEVLTDMARRLRFLHELVSGAEIGADKWQERVSFHQITSYWIDGFNNYLPQSVATKIGADIDHPHMNELPDVIASPLAVRQVVMNLYDNAFKYGRNGDIVIRARIEHPFVVNEFSHLARVTLTQEAVSRMFVERGFRAPEAKALRASGTGVGMWMSRQLMHAMRGELRALPTNHGVTKFILTWRLAGGAAKPGG